MPKRLLHPSRRTIGLRVPDHNVAQALLAELGEPLLSSTLHPAGRRAAAQRRARRSASGSSTQVDLVIDAGPCGIVPTTVVDLTGDAPVITRVGQRQHRAVRQ